MLSEKLRSTNVKLYILLGLILAVFIFFLIFYLKDYYKYYSDLYKYRDQLVQSLTQSQVEKPTFESTDPYKGNPRSTIVIFEYSDLSCESCKAMQSTMKEVEDFYGIKNIFLVWKDMPVTVNPNNIRAHQAARCAQDQKAFWEYKDLLYQNQGTFGDELFLELAKTLNLDGTAFKECLDSQKYKDLVESNFEKSLQLGLDSAPTLFINNREVQSGFNFNNLRSIIESTK